MCPETHVPELYAQERRQFRLIFGAAFAIFFVIALVARFFPERMRPWPLPAGRRLSPIDEARAVTDTVVPFAFL